MAWPVVERVTTEQYWKAGSRHLLFVAAFECVIDFASAVCRRPVTVREMAILYRAFLASRVCRALRRRPARLREAA